MTHIPLDDEPRDPRPVPVWRFIGYAIAAVVVLILLTDSWYTVPPTEMAGTQTLGRVSSAEPIGPGFHFKLPLIESVDYIQTSISRFDLPTVSVHTADNQLVNLGISLTYQIPKSDVFHLLYDVGQSGNTDVDAAITPVISDRALRVFAKHNAINISSERTQIDAQMRESVSQALKSIFGIDVVDLQIRSLTYSDAFTNAVEAAVEAKAQTVQAQNLVFQKEAQAQQAVATAKGEAASQIARAEGDKQSVVLRAQGKAEAIAIVAKAHAQAVAAIGHAMTQNPSYATYAIATGWNGQPPSTIVGQSSGAANPLSFILGASLAPDGAAHH